MANPNPAKGPKHNLQATAKSCKHDKVFQKKMQATAKSRKHDKVFQKLASHCKES